MKQSASLSERLSDAQWRQAEMILSHSEVDVLSCLYWCMDTPQVI